MITLIKNKLKTYAIQRHKSKIERLKKQVEEHYRWIFERITLNWDQYLAFEGMKKSDLEYVERTGELRITALNR